MNNVTCLYTDREAVLVAYLYDDLEPAQRVAFDTHVTTCLPCRSELAEMRGVRSRLAEWVPPEPSRAFSHQSSVVSHQS
jgi:anti-sigma factor RsiW